MNLQNWIAIIGLFLTYLVMGIGAFLKLNIKNTENYKDITSLRKDLEEYKQTNDHAIEVQKSDFKEDIKELKELIKEVRREQKTDYEAIEKILYSINKKI